MGGLKGLPCTLHVARFDSVAELAKCEFKRCSALHSLTIVYSSIRHRVRGFLLRRACHG